MSRGRLWRVTAASAVCCAVAGHAQERVDTGLRLQMSDQLDSVGAASAGPVGSADPRASPPPDDDDALRGLVLEITSGLRFDDNVFRTNRNEVRDTVVVIRPKVFYNRPIGRHDLRFAYEGDLERYQSETSENRFDHDLLTTLDLDISRILKSSLRASLTYGTDPRGDLESRPFTGGDPDRWRRHEIGGKVVLGRRIAKAQVAADYSVAGVRYTNNGQSDRDFDVRTLILDGAYNVGPRLSLLAETSGAWTDYLSPATDLDSRQFTALGGIGWEATAKTRGDVKVGLLHRDFYAPTRPSISGFNWDARVTWAPRTYSQLTAYTSRGVTESGFGGDAGSGVALTDLYGLRWRYGITERLTLDTGVEYATAEFEEGGTDRFTSYEAGLHYRLGRAVNLFGEWGLDTRSGSGGEYEAGSVFLGVDLTLDRPLGR